MLNEQIFELYPEFLNYCQEFQEFIKMCYGINVRIEELQKSDVKSGFEDLMTLKWLELGRGKNSRFSDVYPIEEPIISASWIESIDYEEIDESLADCLNQSYSGPKSLIPFLQELRAKKTPCDFEGSFVTSDMTIGFSKNLIQCTIITKEGQLITIYGELDKNKKLNNISIAFYNDIFDFDHLDSDTFAYDDNPVLNCNIIKKRIEELASKGILPIKSYNLDFKQFLNFNGLEDKYDTPIAALYYAKDIILSMEPKSDKGRK